MEDDDPVMTFARYEKEMEKFLNVNPESEIWDPEFIENSFSRIIPPMNFDNLLPRGRRKRISVYKVAIEKILDQKIVRRPSSH